MQIVQGSREVDISPLPGGADMLNIKFKD